MFVTCYSVKPSLSIHGELLQGNNTQHILNKGFILAMGKQIALHQI